MNIEIIEVNKVKLAYLQSDQVEIRTTQDALDLMMNGYYQGAEGMIIHEKNVLPDFFDLKTKMAGDILQKFSTYNSRLAIIGDFEHISSKSLRDFIYESNQTGRINFVGSLEEAKEKLSRS